MGPSEMGPSHIFPGSALQDRRPATDKLMLRRAGKRREVPTPTAVGWDGPGRATAVQPRNRMADSCFISCAKINSARGPCRVGSCPALPGEGAHFSRRTSLTRMLRSAECLWAARSPRSPGGHKRCGRTRGSFSRDAHGEAREPRRAGFPQKGVQRRGGRGSAWAAEPKNEASSRRSRGQWLFPQDAPSKGQDSARARPLKAAAPGPCGMQVALEGTEPAALGTQNSCHPMPPSAAA